MNYITEKEFIDFEKEKNLYAIISDNLYTKIAIWDIFRHTVYCKFNNIGIEPVILNKEKNIKWKFRIIFSVIISFIKHVFSPKKALFFYLNLRDIDKNGLYFDRNAEDTIKYVKKKKILIDSNYNNQYKKHKNAYKTLARLEPHACKILGLIIKIPYPEKQIHEIIAILKSTKWGNDIDKSFLYNEYKDFYLKYRYYKFLFKYLKPKTVFAIQNGIQKSMFLAAKELGIKTVEFQHGDLPKYQLLYSYPYIKDIKNIIINSDILLIYGNKWEKVSNIQSKVLVLGNNTILPKVEKQKGHELTVISSNINNERKLDAVAIELSKKYPKLIINFKLHPAEVPLLDKVKQSFKEYPNIKVITNQIPRDELFSRTSSALMICSTMAYEMLSLGINIYLLKEPEHLTMEQIFNYENVTLVDNAEDMILKYKVDKDWGKPVSFFEPFHKETIDKILNE